MLPCSLFSLHPPLIPTRFLISHGMQTISETLHLEVSKDAACTVLSNIELLFRLSPHWSLKELKTCEGDKRSEVTLEYYGRDVAEKMSIEGPRSTPDGTISFIVAMSKVREIHFHLERAGNRGIALTQQLVIAEENEGVAWGTRAELIFWLRSIGAYLLLADGRTLYRRLFRKFMDKVWLRLTLPERNMAIIMVKISIVEFALLLITVLFWNTFIN